MDWYSLTFFGDSMLLLPSGIIVFAILMFVCRDWKQTAQWALLFGGVGAIVCASNWLLWVGESAFVNWISPVLAGTPHFPPVFGQ